MANIDIVVPLLSDEVELKSLIDQRIEKLKQYSGKHRLRYTILYTPIFENTEIEPFDTNSLKLIVVNDRGLYKALNIFLSITKSEFFVFEGDNDCLYLDQIDKIFSDPSSLNFDIAITNVFDADSMKLLKPYRLPILGYGANFSVGAFVKSETAKTILFDESYKIAADTHFILKCVKMKKNIVKLNVETGYFSRDGISATNKLKTVREHSKALLKNGFWLESIIFIIPRLIKYAIWK